MLDFRPLTENDLEQLRPFLEKNPFRLCDLTVGGIFIWRDYYRTEYAISGGILYFKVYYPGFGTLFTLPQGGDRREEYRQIQEYCTRRNMPLAFYPIPKEELGALQDYFPCTTAITDRNSFDYLYRSEDLKYFRGKKLGGQRGFVLTFGKKDDKNRLDWSLGGWGGDSAEFVSQINGRSTSLTQERFSPENGVVYECELSVCGRKMTGEVKGYFREEAEDILPAYEELYTTASVDEESGDVILKAVNVRNTPVIAEVNVPGAVSARIYEMAGFAPEAENTFDAPRAVAPAERELTFSGTAELEFKPASVSVIRFRREK